MPIDPNAARPVPVAILTTLLFTAPLALAAQPNTTVPPEVFASRRAHLLEQVGDAPVIVPGAYLVRSGGSGRQDPNFFYLTGVHSPYAILVMQQTDTGIREALFLPDSFQFAGAQYSLDDDRLRRAAWNLPVDRLAPGAGAQRATGISETYSLDEFVTRLDEFVGKRRTIYLARDGDAPYAPPGIAAPTTVRQQFEQAIRDRFSRTDIHDVTPLIRRMRIIKDEHEIALLRHAAEISVAGLIEAMRAVRPGMNDLAVAGLMEAVWKRQGAPRASFGPIVSSGPASMTLYPLRSESYDFDDRIMEAGELLFIDYGAAEYGMYASDICRTIPVSGRFGPRQRYYYEIVLEAQETALAAVRPGVMMIDVVRAAAGVFRKYGFEEFEDIDRMGAEGVWGVMPSPTYYLAREGEFTRYSGARGIGVRDLGHHIGLDALDGRDYSMPLAPGMVFTVEPKLYIPDQNIAIMIEDMILVTEDGYENLSAGAPRTVREIERTMAER